MTLESRLHDMETGPLAVVGTGTQGRRIALMLASQPGEVRVFGRTAAGRQATEAFIEDHLPTVLPQGGAAGEVILCDDLAEAVDGAALVIEAVSESAELKRDVLGELDALAPVEAILASNSSSYPTSELIGNVRHPERVVNTHFYMPPEKNAVEVMSCGRTDPEVIEALMAALPRYGLQPYHVRQQSMGFIFNRIWAAIKRESLAVAAEGVAEPAEIDALFESNLGVGAGPFRLMDAVGLDVVLDIEEHYAAALHGISGEPRRLLHRYVDRGDLGVKTGRGFYDDYQS